MEMLVSAFVENVTSAICTEAGLAEVFLDSRSFARPFTAVFPAASLVVLPSFSAMLPEMSITTMTFAETSVVDSLVAPLTSSDSVYVPSWLLTNVFVCSGSSCVTALPTAADTKTATIAAASTSRSLRSILPPFLLFIIIHP